MLDPAFQELLGYNSFHKFTGMEQHLNIYCALDLPQVYAERYTFVSQTYGIVELIDMKLLMCFNLSQL